jgi:DNA-binding transcriptional regulator YiaG
MASQQSSKPAATKAPELTSDDIRRIREKLGLSQVEAGELLGGGPRAFTKYEGGSIKPAASTANILRMLDADPTALATLTGKRLPPVDSDGSKPFEVTGQHVSALSERKLVNLVRRLLSAEAHKGELPLDGIHVAAVVTAPDGGEDAKIEWTDGPERTKFLPARYTQFQLKASDLSPAEVGGEVLTAKKEVKPMVRAALDAGGTYILVCGQSYTNSKIILRENAIRTTLARVGGSFRDEQIQFRDADQIALWVNTHPPVAAWLLEQTQPGLVGVFRDWSHWSGRYDSFRWIPDKRLEEMRSKLLPLISARRGVARVLGRSGYGKSRLVHEALGPTADEEKESTPRLSDLVLYAVETEVGSVAAKNIVQSLADAGIRAIVVVDRCAQDTHQDLTAIVRRASSRLSLITIDHDVRSTERPAPDVIVVNRADESVIDQMLKQISPDLPTEDHRRLVKFSQGFPQIAVLLGQSWSKESSIAAATDAELFDRIILGRKPSDEPLLRDVGMLLGAFGLLGAKRSLTDLETVASLTRNRSADDLRAALDELSQRGVVQKHGRLVSLEPKPLAMALGEQQWRRWDEARWDQVLAGDLPGDLRVRAATQLALLNDRPISTDVVRHVCRFNGPFASLDGMQREGASQIISALAEIDADTVMDMLDRVFGSLSIEQLKAVEDDARRHLVWALEKMAFREETFEKAALLLLSLAVAENETWGNNATGQFKDLFPVFGASTAAGPMGRLQVLDELIADADPLRMPFVVDALSSGANLNGCFRMIGAETHGSKPSLASWHPKLWKDAFDYVFACLDRMSDLALRHDSIGVQARAGMADTFRTLADGGHIDRIAGWVKKITAMHAYWPQALDALGDVLQYDVEGMKDEDGTKEAYVAKIVALMATLAPKDLASRARFLITEMPWDHPVSEKLEFEKRGKRQIEDVQALVKDLLKQPAELERLLPQLSSGPQRMAYAAGEAVAIYATEPLVWADRMEAAVLGVDADRRNFALLAGYNIGLNAKHPATVEAFKRKAAMSSDFGPAFPILTSSLGITKDDVQLACEGLRAGTVEPEQMINWSYGGVLAKLPAPDVAPVFDQLLSMPGYAYAVAIDLMGMYVHDAAARLEELRPQLILVAKYIGKRPKRRGSQRDAHHFEQIIGWLLKKGREDADARTVAIELANHAAAKPDTVEGLLRPVLPVLLTNFASVIWPVFGKAIVSDQGKAWRLQHLLGDSYSFAEKKNPAILNVPQDLLFAWCHTNPDVGPAFLAQFVPVLESQRPEEGGNKLHPTTKRLLDEFGSREDVLKRLVANMHTFGWSGSRTTYYALYEAPLRSLMSHPIGAVRRWAKTMLDHIIAQIQEAKTEDDEQNAQWDV